VSRKGDKQRMRILLVQPISNTRYMRALYPVFTAEPLALEYVAAGVSSEHDVKILDMRLENGYEGLQQALEGFEPDVVGTTALTCEANAAKRVHAYAKDFNSRILTVAGGIHATTAPDDYIDKNIDVVVIGEGTFTFKELVQHFERGEDFRGIRGIGVPDGGILYRTPARPMCELDALPFPDRSLTSHIRHRYRNNVWADDIALLRTTAGCPYRCNFCICWKLTDGRYVQRDVEDVVKELSTIKEHYIMLSDDEAFLNPKRAMRLAQRIKEEGIDKRYFVFVRADTICQNPDLVEMWAQVGLSEAFIGTEAMTDGELEAMEKTTRVSDNDKAIDIIQSNLDCMTIMMIRPDYGKEDFKRVDDYAKRKKLVSPAYQVMTPIPGSGLHESLKDQIVVHNYDLWDYNHAVLPTKLGLKEFYSELANLWLYHREPAHVEYFMRKLAAVPPEEANERLINISRLAAAIEDLYGDHQLVEQGA
jgi:radical SAM superfamily enzyme YgiQ (UPF0313 family)